MPILTNSNPSKVEELRSLPLKLVNGSAIYLRDVAQVYDGHADQSNIVRVNGHRATYLAILKKSDASTLAVVDAAKEMLPLIKAAAPKGLELNFDFDQSRFVRGAISDVVKEGVIASLLVSLMVLFFLGSWRSMLLVCTSIPLAIFVGIIGLKLSGQTLNIMTLGGLSLAVGMLVDDATVEVENIHRNYALGKPLTVAILDGASQIAVPAIVATLAICIVFFPVLLLVGPAKFLFTPLAMAVVFSMLASYLLSRTLVPTLARMLLGKDIHTPKGQAANAGLTHVRSGGPREDVEAGLVPNIPLDDFPDAAGRSPWTEWPASMPGGNGASAASRPPTCASWIAYCTIGISCWRPVRLRLHQPGTPFLPGPGFLPRGGFGLMKLHVRAPAGLRLEETERVVTEVERTIRECVPARELTTVNSNIGMPSSFNLAFIPSDNVTSQDADIFISLQKEHHPTGAT